MIWLFTQKRAKKPVGVSAYQGELAVGFTYGSLALFAGGTPQSGGEFVSMWNKILEKVTQNDFQPSKVLVLGVGGGTVIGGLQKYLPQAQILGIDIDPDIIQAAYSFFGLQKNKLCSIRIKDAVSFVAATKKHFDLIIVDLFIKDRNPPRTREKNFVQDLKKILKPDGLIVYNSHYKKNNRVEYKEFINLLTSVFLQVEEIFQYPLNHVLLMK